MICSPWNIFILILLILLYHCNTFRSWENTAIHEARGIDTGHLEKGDGKLFGDQKLALGN